MSTIPRRHELAFNLVLAVGSALVVNGILFAALPANALTADRLAPAGIVIGAVWVALFAAMAAARWQLGLAAARGQNDRRSLVTMLGLFCLVYPFYAILPESPIAGLLGNIATLLFASATIWAIRPISRAAALLIAPLVPWLVFATLTILIDMPTR